MADKLLDVEIVTPQRSLFVGKAKSVTVPGSKSPFQVLYNHAPIVSSLDLGFIKIVSEDDKAMYFANSPGFTEVRDNKASILVESAINVSDLNEEELKLQIDKAEGVISEKASPEEKLRAQKSLDEARNSLKLLMKRKEL